MRSRPSEGFLRMNVLHDFGMQIERYFACRPMQTVDEPRTLVGQAEAQLQAAQEHEALPDLADAFGELICDVSTKETARGTGTASFDSV